VEIVRPKVEPKCTEVFTSWIGKTLQSSHPSKKLHSLWKASGIFEGKEIPKNLTINHIKKSVSTPARAEGNKFTKEIATIVVHSEKTANIHYDIFEQDHASTIGAQQIQSLFRGIVLTT